MKDLFSVEGKVIVITGATGIIGRELVKHFAEQRAKVVVLGRAVQVGEGLVAEVKAAGGEAMFLECDVHQNKDNMYVFKTEHRTSAAYMVNPSYYPHNFSMNATTSVPFEAFRTGVDAETYFTGMQTYAQAQYDEYFKKYVE